MRGFESVLGGGLFPLLFLLYRQNVSDCVRCGSYPEVMRPFVVRKTGVISVCLLLLRRRMKRTEEVGSDVFSSKETVPRKTAEVNIYMKLK